MPDAYKNTTGTFPYQPVEFSPGFPKPSGLVEEYQWAVIEGLLTPVRKRVTIAVSDEDESSGNNEDHPGDAVISFEEQQAAELLSGSERLALEIVEKAEKQAEELKKQAREKGEAEGYEKGYADGKKQAEAETRDEMNRELKSYFSEIRAVVKSIEAERSRLVENSVGELKDLALTIAEKVIRISLKSSSGIIEELIAASTERVTARQWVKISISGYDVEMMEKAGVDLAEKFKGLSDKLTVEVLDQAPEGTCVIEFPDQIIDAGVDTQIDNIKKLLS